MVLSSLYVRYAVNVGDSNDDVLAVLKELSKYVKVKKCVKYRGWDSDRVECAVVASDEYEVFVGELYISFDNERTCRVIYDSHEDVDDVEKINERFNEFVMESLTKDRLISNIYEDHAEGWGGRYLIRACVEYVNVSMQLSGDLIALVDIMDNVHPRMELWSIFRKYGSVERTLFRSM